MKEVIDLLNEKGYPTDDDLNVTCDGNVYPCKHALAILNNEQIMSHILPEEKRIEWFVDECIIKAVEGRAELDRQLKKIK